jgi:pimeloyl-ACP methyl ester carboxylesterase
MGDLGVTVSTVPDAAHMVHFEQPAALARLAVDFLTTPGARR